MKVSERITPFYFYLLLFTTSSICGQEPLQYIIPADLDSCGVDFDLTIGDCYDVYDRQYCFDTDFMWMDDPTALGGPSCVFPAYPTEGIAFEGGCAPYHLSVDPPYAPDQTEVIQPDGSILILDCLPVPYDGTITWTITDDCGDQLVWEFPVMVECLNCPPAPDCQGRSFRQSCVRCETATPEPATPCYSCDGSAFNDWCTCTPPGSSLVDTTQFSNPLCNDGFVPNNMAWWSFTTGSEKLELKISEINCVGGSIGVQTGIYAKCELTECLASDNSCGSNDDKSFVVTDLIVGDTYYIYTDGCMGSACSYKINVEGTAPFDLDEPLSITAISDTKGEIGDPCNPDNVITACVGEELQFIAHHSGSSLTNFGIYDAPCSVYPPGFDVTFFWSFSPELNGLSMESFIWPDETIPPIRPTELGSYLICLDGADQVCDETEDRACMTLNVVDCELVDADGDGSPASEDCDDSNANNFPGNVEICDGQDNNCNDEIDEGLQFLDYFVDTDGDGYGSGDTLSACTPPFGYVTNDLDCNDSDPLINPDADEVSGNGVDEDCDGEDGPSSAVHVLGGFEVDFYPNPVKNRLTVATQLQGLEYQIHNTSGQLVGAGVVRDAVDFSELDEGCYFLTLILQRGKQRVVEKIIKI